VQATRLIASATTTTATFDMVDHPRAARYLTLASGLPTGATSPATRKTHEKRSEAGVELGARLAIVVDRMYVNADV
jgi:hypothetical protein